MATSPDVPTRAKPGTRGAKTRSRLMDSARTMLKTASPIELTAIAVSRAAGTAPPSFYVYFADTRDLLLALAEDASEAMKALGRHFEPPAMPPADPLAWAEAFVEDFVATWDHHCEVLAFRNLEADRGDARFDELRVTSALPVLNGLTDAMLVARPAGSRRVASFAEAVIHYAVLERIATVDRTTQPIRLQPHHYKSAVARMIAAAVGGAAGVGCNACGASAEVRRCPPSLRPCAG
jgi:AcrR family transcriptional regulator